MKDFLYLVQASSKHVDAHLALESKRADVLIHTFDAKVNKPNCLYKKNTSWAVGRNLLVEAAQQKKKRYRYYVLLDQDIIFKKGSFAEFEDEVLKVKPDFCMPSYMNKRATRLLSRRTPFRYSSFIDFDNCFNCMTEELFFGGKLFPYHLEVNGVSCEKDYYHNYRSFFDLFENYPKHKLLVLNRIHVRNSSSAQTSKWPDPYTEKKKALYQTLRVKETDGGALASATTVPRVRPLIFLRYKDLSNLAKAMPFAFIILEEPLALTLASHKASKLRKLLAQGAPDRVMGLKRVKSNMALKTLEVWCSSIWRYHGIMLKLSVALTLWRDLKLNCRLLLDRNKHK